MFCKKFKPPHFTFGPDRALKFRALLILRTIFDLKTFLIILNNMSQRKVQQLPLLLL